MSKKNENIFDAQKKESELKLMLSHLLEDLDGELSSALYQGINLLTDKEIMELIVKNRDFVSEKKIIIKEFLNILTDKNPKLKIQLLDKYGREFLIKYELL